MYYITEIIEFVTLRTGCEDVTADSNIVNNIGCVGDEINELMNTYGM
ncbi:MAG: hypothetical protein H7068_09710 [Pedobacter sp.]|nr:hypothetical protein [Chitinophagaceae bacterium]